jgi:tetratricopeptide (TPR) repeat protein
MRRSILALLAVLTLGAPPLSPADTASDDVVRQITEKLRQRDGREPTDEELVEALNVATVTLLNAGKYREAESVARVTLERGERVLGAEHPDTLGSINNLASLYQDQGRYGEAEPLLRRSLAAKESVLGAEHPRTLTGLNNLAFLYEDQGRYGEAETLYRRTLAT